MGSLGCFRGVLISALVIQACGKKEGSAEGPVSEASAEVSEEQMNLAAHIESCLGAGQIESALQSNASTKKVLMCKVPPGNPENAHEIVVGVAAVPAQLLSGSFIGPCVGEPNSQPPEGSLGEGEELPPMELPDEVIACACGEEGVL